jgi:hypothetical protein
VKSEAKTSLPIINLQPRKELVEGLDFYFDKGLMVLTAHFLRERGYCCGNGCRHCPYEKEKKAKLQQKIG